MHKVSCCAIIERNTIELTMHTITVIDTNIAIKLAFLISATVLTVTGGVIDGITACEEVSKYLIYVSCGSSLT